MASQQALGIESNGDEKHTLKLLQRLKDVTQSEIYRSAVTPLMRCLPKSHALFQPPETGYERLQPRQTGVAMRKAA